MSVMSVEHGIWVQGTHKECNVSVLKKEALVLSEWAQLGRLWYSCIRRLYQ
jgi:hypothetical protein